MKTVGGTTFPDNVSITSNALKSDNASDVMLHVNGLTETTPFLVITFKATVGDEVCIKLRPILYVGDTVPAFEPYTGGQPSPSPDYPQEIVSAGMKWSTGKNLLKYPYVHNESSHDFKGVNLSMCNSHITMKGKTTGGNFVLMRGIKGI